MATSFVKDIVITRVFRMSVGSHRPHGILQGHGWSEMRRRVEGLHIPAWVDNRYQGVLSEEVCLVPGSQVSMEDIGMITEKSWTLEVFVARVGQAVRPHSQVFDHLERGQRLEHSQAQQLVARLPGVPWSRLVPVSCQSASRAPSR